MKIKFIVASIIGLFLSAYAIAEDITGKWLQIDDKTGTSKAVIEIRQEGTTYTAKIVKVTPRPGYIPQEKCKNCPAPYTNQSILGMDVLRGLKHMSENNYDGGRIIDPLTGKIYSAKAKLNNTGKRLTLRGYIGISAIGRSQTWIRQE